MNSVAVVLYAAERLTIVSGHAFVLSQQPVLLPQGAVLPGEVSQRILHPQTSATSLLPHIEQCVKRVGLSSPGRLLTACSSARERRSPKGL